MADEKISDYDALAETPADGDLFEVVDVSDPTDAATGTNKKVTRANLVGGLATSAQLTAHTGDTSDAHDASAISIVDAGGYFTETDVEGALQELGAGGGGGGASDLDDLTDVTITSATSGDVLRHNGSVFVNTPGTTHFDAAGAASAVDASLSAHISDSSAAHAASAVSFSAVGTIAGTDVQTAVAEVATDAATALSSHEADTTSIHGITDTSTLVTLAGSQTLTNKSIDAAQLTGTVANARLDQDLQDIAGLTRTKGDLIVGTSSAWVDLAVGTDGHVLTADAAQTSGVKWAAAGAGSFDPSSADHVVSARMFSR